MSVGCTAALIGLRRSGVASRSRKIGFRRFPALSGSLCLTTFLAKIRIGSLPLKIRIGSLPLMSLDPLARGISVVGKPFPVVLDNGEHSRSIGEPSGAFPLDWEPSLRHVPNLGTGTVNIGRREAVSRGSRQLRRIPGARKPRLGSRSSGSGARAPGSGRPFHRVAGTKSRGTYLILWLLLKNPTQSSSRLEQGAISTVWQVPNPGACT